MPSKTRAQAHLMAAVAHGWKMPGGGGPTREVAEEFHQADKQRGKWEHPAHRGKLERLASRNRKR